MENVYVKKMETKTLEVWFKDGRYRKFNNYTVDTYAIVKHKATGDILRPYENKEMYNVITVRDEFNKQYKIRLARAVSSTFYGKPETLNLTVDHIDRNRTNDVLDNLRWACGTTQGNNRNTPDILKSAFIVVKDGVEKTVQGWVDELKDKHNSFGREYENGCHDGTQRARQKCASYIKGIFEKEHTSLHEAAKYLKSNGFAKAHHGKIGMVLTGDRKTAYKRMWKPIP